MARKKMSNLQVVKTQDDRKALRQRERRIKRRRRKELLTYIKEEVNHILQINNRMLWHSPQGRQLRERPFGQE